MPLVITRYDKNALESRRRITDDGCWVWTGYLNRDGYGDFHTQREPGPRLVHRLAWMLYRGPIPPVHLVLHRCDNPPCFNPDHLFLGTHADNIADKIYKGRQARGENQGNSRLTNEKVAAIRSAYVKGQTSLKSIGEQFGVHQGTVWQIVRGKTWRLA